jgi:hypothetical protein
MASVPTDPLSVWCPHCGACPDEECYDDHEHTARVAAALDVDPLPYWPWPDEDREAWLSAMPYKDFLRTPEWRERREIMLNRAGYSCQDCGDDHRLQVHHLTYERRGAEWPGDLMVLCDACHIACHPTKRRQGASVSYGAYVQACIDERRRRAIGRQPWDYAAVKYASDNFPDYPEARVVEVLVDLRWPDRPVTVGEVHKQLKQRVTAQEKRAWEAWLEGQAA